MAETYCKEVFYTRDLTVVVDTYKDLTTQKMSTGRFYRMHGNKKPTTDRRVNDQPVFLIRDKRFSLSPDPG